MKESRITVEGVPLEDHLEDKEKRILYDDNQAEIAGRKQLIYNSSGIKMTVKHNKRPSGTRHITVQEYYMKDNIKRCKVGGEYVLTIMQDGLPQNMNSLAERFVHFEINMGPSGVRQAFIKVNKRYPDLFEVVQGHGHQKVYTMIPAACKITHEDLLMLWRKKISWEQMVEINPDLKRVLTSKVLASPEASTISITEIFEKLNELHALVVGMDTNITDLNECNDGLEQRLFKMEQLSKLFEKAVSGGGEHHTLDINVNFNFGRKDGG
jgi:hypothetical protein